MPGLVDTHVHVNEPGRTDWEGFATATAAAAAGGVTTIIDMPLNSIPPTIDVAALDAKRAAAEGQCAVDVGFWGGAVPSTPRTARRCTRPACSASSASCSTRGARVPAARRPRARRGDAAGRRAGRPAHRARRGRRRPSRRRRPRPAATTPASCAPGRRAAEVAAIIRVLRMAAATGARVHVLHLSQRRSRAAARRRQADGVRISAETCPHYLTLAAEQVPDGATEFKCCPPIRGVDNRERLWAGDRATARSTASCPTTRRARPS